LKLRVGAVKLTNSQLVDLVQLHREEAEKMRNEILAWENAEVPAEVMAETIVELEKRGFITHPAKTPKKGTREMNNKPYGWVKNGEYVLYIDKPDSVFNYTPLYTHPANLTDEEIEDALYVADITLDNLSDGDISMERIKAFVRTVLRKAQENG